MTKTHRGWLRSALPCSLLTLVLAVPALAQPSFITFESGPVRPLAMSPDGTRLFVTNIPDGRLEIFALASGVEALTHVASVPVGLEPVAVAARNNDEVWVVNHLSDSISIVDVSASPPRVTKTLLVGDEPRDIVFADPPGATGQRAFVTTAHRGQNNPADPQLLTAGVGRADVWVFDAASPGGGLGGTPVGVVTVFGDTPRPLAVSNDQSTVYVGVFNSGNQTTVVSEGVVCDDSNYDDGSPAGPCSVSGSSYPGGNPGPSKNHQGVVAPEVGLIVQFNPSSGNWEDELGRNWNNGVKFDLPDKDVFAIDADTLSETSFFTGVGTTLFNMAVNPASGKVYVSNTEARNEVRFEGAGGGGSTVQGHLAEARITVLDGATVNPRHLNKHINYAVTPAPAGTKDHSLATPVEMAVSSDGTTLYVAAFGSSKVGVFATATLENDSFDPTVQSASYIDLSGGGPGGLVLDEARSRLYVLTRFDNSVSVVDTGSGSETRHVALHNPEPSQVVEGRPFLYDAAFTSSNGEASCAACHIFGDMDQLAWDLGDPDANVTNNPIPINLAAGAGSEVNGGAGVNQFHPMKGPMTTQTLRGLVNGGAMHWRGDRATGAFGTGAFDEDLSFRNFVFAFQGLVGRDSVFPAADMQKFADFALEITLPPNPIRLLANDFPPGSDEERGRDFFLGNEGPGAPDHRSDGIPLVGGLGFTCEGCHTLDNASGFFGTNGTASFENETQIVKIPHLRNLYQKIGMFGMPAVPFNNTGDNGHKGDQIRGYGFLHDGSTDTIFRFFQATVFDEAFFGLVGFNGGDAQRLRVEQFMLAFDSDLAPIVGQQVTLDAGNGASVGPRIDLMIARSQAAFQSQILGGTATDCDLVVRGAVAGEERGWLHVGSGDFQSDRSSEGTIPDAGPSGLRAKAQTAGQSLTYTCATPGSGTRVALDRDEDGFFDTDETDAGTEPDNAASFPGACNDGVDNDGDGATDLGDPGCLTTGSDIENPDCNDGLDNDGDGRVDSAQDLGCLGMASGSSEFPTVCGLGVELALLLPGLMALRRRRARQA